MLASSYSHRGSWRLPRLRLMLWPLAAMTVCYLLFSRLQTPAAPPRSAHTLIQQHIDHSAGTGGRWYIPEAWLSAVKAPSSNMTLISSTTPANVLEAAQLALELSLLVGAFAHASNIPLVAHQTWRSLETSNWPESMQDSVGGWLEAATGHGPSDTPQMAYILWDDEGIDELIKQYEPHLWDLFQGLPYPVEKADTFRVAVLRWFGGVYADVDVRLLQHPSRWIHQSDLSPWDDGETSTKHDPPVVTPEEGHYQIPLTSPSPYQEIMARLHAENAVGAVYGIECDAPPDSNDYWRMGYSYPLQLTNWAFAMAPQHPSAVVYLAQLAAAIQQNSTHLSGIDPLDLTGPPALTRAVKEHCESVEDTSFRWDSLTGRQEPQGGRGKVVAGDVLVLPITAFSPGRGWFHNMGSMPVDHPNARLAHVAQGSWRRKSVSVEAGKLCRTMLGRCKDWKKIP